LNHSFITSTGGGKNRDRFPDVHLDRISGLGQQDRVRPWHGGQQGGVEQVCDDRQDGF